jgi:biopolymer transport protein ExbB/TolQ
MPPGAPDTPARVFVLAILLAVAVCMLTAAVMVPTMLGGVGAWPVFAVSFLVLVAALVALWKIQARRDRTLQ